MGSPGGQMQISEHSFICQAPSQREMYFHLQLEHGPEMDLLDLQIKWVTK